MSCMNSGKPIRKKLFRRQNQSPGGFMSSLLQILMVICSEYFMILLLPSAKRMVDLGSCWDYALNLLITPKVLQYEEDNNLPGLFANHHNIGRSNSGEKE